MTSADDRITRFNAEFGITLMNDSQAALPPPLRDLHRTVLTAFVNTGEAPSTNWVSEQAARFGLDPDQALGALDRADLVHTADGAVTVAYPFSGVPTPHRVQLDDGATSWAMCAGDSLGIPLMAGRDATISSADPHTGEGIHIQCRDGAFTWQPDSTVVLVGATTGCGTAAEAACGHVNFFADPVNAEAYLRAHPAVTGEIYDQSDAVEMGRFIFGPLLDR
ncbi:alkylmercury lyase-like protein [Haloactinopolyspora alba]|uniref:Alkylmercury lyase-like protein n=1 Tax=Haloactinopolyspora alba TaxID=648780 RepID=A0A2P8DWR9_9ACTN|nr:alkylmercury lyase family protein [Haloactinopolyspora alba]PSL01652.1 alkylmercury lyase-like protein [Haloactinopolyspora alba]